MSRNHIFWLITTIIFFSIVAAIYFFDVAQYISLENLQTHSLFLANFSNNNYFLSAILYTSVFVIAIAFSVPVSGPLTLLGGFLFGVFGGLLFALFGATTGAMIAFLFFRKGKNEFAKNKYGKKLEKFKQRIEQHGASYLLILHFSTMVPYALINMLAALTGISLFTVFWTTIVGFLPSALVYAFAGSRFTTISSMRDIFSPMILFALLLLMIIVFLPIVVKRIKRGRS